MMKANFEAQSELMNNLQKFVNQVYELWCMTNDPYEEDFNLILVETFPKLTFSFAVATHEWIIVKIDTTQ